MNRKINNITATIRTAAKASALVMMFAFAASAQAPALSSKMVTLYFVDSVMVNDTLIRIGDIAKVECADAALAGQVRAMAAGEAAPAGFSRYINSEDLLMYNVRPHLKGISITGGNTKRVKVTSDYREKTVGQFEDVIRSYVESRIGWAKGEWELSITNPQLSWKSGAGDVEVEVTGLENQYLKGNTGLTLIARQGSRTSRIPVMCRISVKANVLTATRAIERGEEFNSDNSKAQVIDITNFAYAPLRSLPEAGTKAAARAVQAGNILHDKMLRAIPVVARGDQVRIHFIGERINVSVLGVARDNGGSGDRIWVENLQTRKLIRAAVSGKGSVVVHKEGDRS
ncbi:MAG: flagellar basal body P-ring formation chaperone FlgA [Chitinispirillia bacterium]|nr:flagellar basal body P-ring formation chaperone FlgA [Chitinispirillia bacterium]MCL2242166.1 flagellar basal body P-ring formation chaperone FlgA [Chitinispirillia bacterium]